jgi:hypothetical protein
VAEGAVELGPAHLGTAGQVAALGFLVELLAGLGGRPAGALGLSDRGASGGQLDL